ncbi:YIP1 family protein [Sporosarcina sp. BI001-red]|uniref:YIP1 family protein n=1 Tax=Sporosarcina sp. BI001-red TaxID=2282866 RepID=UPI000E259892|nr:YIP1 family protein [Sporosarcina sp. BI001-red]REB05247.1 YIP1 family protein [Sporosarcina sp. BI001-red]
MNPFFSIWVRPSETIHYVLDHKTLSFSSTVLILATLAIAPLSFIQLIFIKEIPLIGILLIAFLGLLMLTAAGWFLNSALYTWIGKWLGGTGTYKKMLAVVPLGSLPTIYILPFSWLLMIVLIILRYSESDVAATIFGILIVLTPFLSLGLMGLSVYGTVIMSKAIGIVHGFSAWKGFGTIAILMGFVFVLTFAVSIFFFFFIFALASF